MRVGLALLLLAGAVAAAGCSETPADCGEGQQVNPHEGRCIDATDPSAEACHVWLSGSVDDADGDLTCQARSEDGRAWLDVQITTSSPFPIEVRDGDGRVAFQQSVQYPRLVELAGAKGMWTLSVDFGDVAGSGSVVLWG